jgi:HD superfamily phosphohydrolase
MAKTQRIRDPVHGLIVFRKTDALAQVAWALLNTPEFQRLRRIKQLGFCDYIFPGATHTRFAHCVGVFETARKLVSIIEREQGHIEPERAEVAVLAALLHDVGHGPFSHTFEQVQRLLGFRKRHEEWTAQLVRDPNGNILPILEKHRQGLAEAVADLLAAESPVDIYHAIVSSSFDADRLDYLRRDRLMTGSGAGAIDFDWLLENLRIETIDLEAPAGEGPPIPRVTFCLDAKAVEAAEAFLLARFHLYTQVYLHKTTRGIEQMLAALLGRVAAAVCEGRFAEIGIDREHPLVRYFAASGEDPAAYAALEDAVIWGALERFGEAPDACVREMANRLRYRRLYKALDIETIFPDSTERQRRAIRKIEQEYADEIGWSVLKDRTTISIYGVVGADDAQAQKRLMILTANGLREITELSRAVDALSGAGRPFTRFYFADPAVCDRAAEGIK